MKKIYFIFCMFITGTSAFGQTVPNGNMELWHSNMAGFLHPLTVEAPNGWYGADSLFISLGQTYGGSLAGIPDTVWHRQLFKEDVLTHGGSHAAKLITAVQDTIMFPGVLSNAQAKVSFSLSPFALTGVTYTGGTSVTVKPRTISAWVRYAPGPDTSAHPHVPAIDSGYLLVQSLYHIGSVDSVIGTGRVTIGNTAGAWVQITANINYPVDTTDSVTILRVTFASSNGGLTKAVDSSTLYVDDITMTSTAEPIQIVHTGVHMIAADNAVKVYPNPAKGLLYIDGPKDASITCSIYSLSGQLVQSGQFNSKGSIDVSALPPAEYVYSVADASGNMLQNGKVSLNR